jgi:4-diphosphocytidyl-2-C-methyl-D-erythritol kinase
MSNLVLSHKTFSPAKLNLHLNVTGKKFHFHTLKMLNVLIDFSDEILFDVLSEPSKGVQTSFEPSYPQIGKNNLITRAYSKFCEFNEEIRAVSVHIKKEIPPGSGLGGGSSNAAQALSFFNSLWPLYTKETLLKTALELGSDVPFFVYGKTALVEGIGEIITSLDIDLSEWWIVLVIPGIFLSTAEVFNKYDEMLHYHHEYECESSKFHKLELFPLHNDLTLPAISIQPSIADLLHDIKKCGARDASMSGSGSSCFGLFDDFERADKACAKLLKKYPLVKVLKVLS